VIPNGKTGAKKRWKKELFLQEAAEIAEVRKRFDPYDPLDPRRLNRFGAFVFICLRVLRSLLGNNAAL